MKIYNTLTRTIEEFKPIKDKKVSMYYCGPTVYWTQHIGNLRGMFCADLVVRILKYLGYKVKFVRNYTDVGHLTSDADTGEDKMITIGLGVKCENCGKIFDSKIAVTKKAFDSITLTNNSHQCPYCNHVNLVKDKSGYVLMDDKFKAKPQQIADKYIKIYEHDTAELNLNDPDVKPRATKYIKEMIKMVQTLLDKGFAYTTDLAVYFDVTKAKNYNQLSRQNLDEQIKGAGSGEVEDPQKKHAPDFALWFFKAGKHQNAIQTWPSPFKSSLVTKGEGFPGWHIECSAMSKKNLGDTLDIHMGGIEHIPVHHTNEIAQSESANGVKFVDYWLHNEHLTVNGGKMSKSEGTAYSLQEVEAKGFKPLVLRYFFLQAQYRSKQNFTWEALQASQNGLDRIYSQVLELGKVTGKVNKEFKDKFVQTISDDFNSPQALAVLQEVLKSDLNNADKLATVLDFDKVLGLSLDKVKKEKLEIPQEVQALVKERELARRNKDWAKSDELRDRIGELGYIVEDTNDGQIIKRK
jgi:cysteinyl-tRNA synthetase